MRLLAHWYYMLRATAGLFFVFARARWYFQTQAFDDLQLPHADSLTSQERRRLQHYYYGGTFLSIVFCALRGRGRSAGEKHRLTNMAALAYFFDDLVDSFRNRDDTGVLWRDNPEEYGLAADDHRRLALHFLHNLYEELPPEQLQPFRDTMHRVFNVETAGRQQSNQPLALAEIDKITREKGGFSVLLFRMVHAPLPHPGEAAALVEFGHLIQYCDDIFDLWFDHQSNTATVATEAVRLNGLADLEERFSMQMSRVKQAFLAVQVPYYRKMTALCVIHFIAAITLVCLAHYQRLLKKEGVLPLHERKKMVVDMEEWGNRIRTAWVLAMRAV